MDPRQLLELCLEAVNGWNQGGRSGSEPTIMLVVPRTKCPRGETIAMFGKAGPRGRIATIKETPAGYDVVAYFPAIATMKIIAEAVGMKIDLEDARETAGYPTPDASSPRASA